MNWKERAFDSHYQTAVAVKEELDAGHVDEAEEGLKELIDAMSRSEKHGMRSQLVRLMLRVIKWKTQPEKRTPSWAVSIVNARSEIEDSQEDMPAIDRRYIESVWDKSFKKAVRLAEAETNVAPDISVLTWQEVFDDEYRVEKNGD